MKNIFKYLAIIIFATGSLAINADKLKIANDTDELIYVALVTTSPKKDLKSKAFVFQGDYAKILGSVKAPTALGIHQGFDVENFKSSSKYDRTLWVSNNPDDLATALRAGQASQKLDDNGNVYVYEVGGYNKAVVIRRAQSLPGFKFDPYKILKPKLSNNATITEIYPKIQVLSTKV